jgi:hypothetical protein
MMHAPYGNERPYNAFRLALNLVKREGTHIRVFFDERWRQLCHRGTENALWVLQRGTHVKVSGKAWGSRNLRDMPGGPWARA